MRVPSPSAPAAWSGGRPRAPPGASAARITELQQCGLGGSQFSLGIQPALIARGELLYLQGQALTVTARSADEGLRGAAVTHQSGASRCPAGSMEALKPEEARRAAVIDTRRRMAIRFAQALALASPDRAPSTKHDKPPGPGARRLAAAPLQSPNHAAHPLPNQQEHTRPQKRYPSSPGGPPPRRRPAPTAPL